MWRMKIQLLLTVCGLWCAVRHGQCSEQRHKHTQNTQPEGDTHTEKRTEHQASVSSPLFISAVDSSSSSSSSRVTHIFPVPAAPCVCGSSCSSSSSTCAAAEESLCDAPLSFPAGQESVSIRQSRKHSKESSGKRSNTSRILKEQGSSSTADTDHTPPCRDQQIPTFEEWSKIMMEEEKSQVSQHLSQSLHNTGKKLQQIFTNYASVECGAKILSSNPEAKSTSAILMENMDMYMLNPCNNKIWFTIELCQPIQVRQLDIANFEIFSSNPREFLVSISDRYPTKKWVRLGTFRARDERTVQSFPLDEHQFARYIKVELLSHFGSEHFCPLSLIRVFGTSMMEEYELNSESSDRHTHTQEDHDYDQSAEFEHQSSRNLIGSAKDALFTMVNNIAANVIGAHPKTAGRSGNSSSEGLNRTGALSPEESHSTNRSVGQSGVSAAVSASPESLSVAPEEQQIVTLLPEAEDEPDADVHEHTHTLQDGRTHTLHDKYWHTHTLQEYLLQRCSAPEVISPTPTPLTHIHTHPSSDAQLESGASFSVTEPLEPGCVSECTADTHTSEEDTKPSSSSSQGAPSGPAAPADAPLDSPEPADASLDTPPEDSNDVEPPDATLDLADPQNASTAAHSGNQKESVFMRLSNRIRVLEMNMSLSGRYLEQLSQRYRRQVEEMQRAFNNTIIKLQNTTTMAEEQDQRQTDSIQALQAQLENVSVLLLQLSVSVDQLQQEVWDRQVYLLLCVLLCVLLVLLLCVHQRQLRETAAAHTHTHTSCSTTDRECSGDGGVCVRRRASDPPALSALRAAKAVCERATGPEHPAVSKKSSKLAVPECVSAAVCPQVSVHQECVRVEDVLSDGSSEGSQADDTLFCGISSCTHLCDALPAAARWTHTTHTSQRRRGGRRPAERLQRTHTHTPPQRRGPLLEP